MTQFYAGISEAYSAEGVQKELFCRVDGFSEGFREMNSAGFPKKDLIRRVHGQRDSAELVGDIDTYKRV